MVDTDMINAIETIKGLGTWKKSRIALVQIGNTRWFVQVQLGFNPLLYQDLIEDREFETREEANRCFQALIPLAHDYPHHLVYALNTYN